jgi:hypothetical protein
MAIIDSLLDVNTYQIRAMKNRKKINREINGNMSTPAMAVR